MNQNDGGCMRNTVNEVIEQDECSKLEISHSIDDRND